MSRSCVYSVELNDINDFTLIDIRPNISFSHFHIENSLNLQTENEILAYIKNNPNDKICLVCFSQKRSKTFAKIINEKLGYNRIFYLDETLIEAKNSGLKFIDASINQEKSIDLLVNSTKNDLKKRYLDTNRIFIVTFSGGKDSTAMLRLFYEMLLSLPKELLRPSYAVISNTLVEPPNIIGFVKDTINAINTHAQKMKIPFKVLEVSPSLKDDFWVNLIGKGYPSPTRTFRWCTERLKINPTKTAVANIIKKHTHALLLLGTRYDESANRANSMRKRVSNEAGYTKHDDYPDTLCFAPIANWTTEDVWMYLMNSNPPWGSHGELFNLYTSASGDECQFITDLSQSSCGGSRFGCYVCTVVNEDKSMQGFINSGDKKLKPLNDFRNYIKNLRENPEARADYRRNGYFTEGIKGPFLSKSRIEIFYKLLQAEKMFIENGGVELISEVQIDAIQNEWDKDFDIGKSAIKIAKEFGRMQDVEIKKGIVLDVDLLQEVAQEQPGGLSAKELENFLSTAVEISRINGRNTAYAKIKEKLNALLDDKTSKREDNVY